MNAPPNANPASPSAADGEENGHLLPLSAQEPAVTSPPQEDAEDVPPGTETGGGKYVPL